MNHGRSSPSSSVNIPEIDRRGLNRKRRKQDRLLVAQIHDYPSHIIMITADGQRIPCRPIDMSNGNCSFHLDHPPRPNEQLHLEIQIAKDTRTIQGHVVTSQPGGNGFFRCGVRFSKPLDFDFERTLSAKNFHDRRESQNVYVPAARFSKRLDIVRDEKYCHHYRSRPQDEYKFADFTSNDYLGLARNPKVLGAAAEAIKNYGLGTGGPAAFAGFYDIHGDLSKRIASLKGMEACLLCPTGFSANSGLFSGIIQKSGTIIFLDIKDHASIFHGAMASKGKICIFKHNDLKDLERKLSTYDRSVSKVICVDGLYSLDGDLAPLAAIYKLAAAYGATLWVDDAHSFGVYGENGCGIEGHWGLKGKVDIVTGSLSKTLGAMGGFICASQSVVDYLEHFSREFVYTTTLPATIVAGVLEGMQFIESEQGDQARKKLWENVEYFRNRMREAGIPIGQTKSQIIPVLIGQEKPTLQLAHELIHEGVYVNVASRPAVRRDEARLRLSVGAHLNKEQLDHTIKSILRVSRQLGIGFSPSSDAGRADSQVT